MYFTLGKLGRFAARHSLLTSKGTEWLSLVSWAVNQQGHSKIWNSIAYFIALLSTEPRGALKVTDMLYTTCLCIYTFSISNVVNEQCMDLTCRITMNS